MAEIILKPELPGAPVLIHQILKTVGNCRRGDIVSCPINHIDRLYHTKDRLNREFPNSNFKVSRVKIELEWHLKIEVL